MTKKKKKKKDKKNKNIIIECKNYIRVLAVLSAIGSRQESALYTFI